MSNKNIHGLFTEDDDKQMKTVRGDSSSENESDDEGRQGFFVGGSDRSGQEVLGPNRGDLQSRLFDAIQRAGAERLTPEQVVALGQQQQQRNPENSTGTGYRLGGHGIQTEHVGGTSASQSTEDMINRMRQQKQVVVHMHIWQNGFTIDDGPLRSFQENAAFLKAVMSKRIPPELNALYPGREVDLRIEMKNAEYVPPKAKPFSGTGYRLGSVTPEIVGNSSRNVEVVDLEPPPALLKPEESEELLRKAQEEIKLDESKPVTRIQIRFPDVPQPVIARLNEDHLVDELRSFIVAVQPSLAYRPFRIMQAYPRKVVDNEEQSLKDAGLLNTGVIVKFDEE